MDIRTSCSNCKSRTKITENVTLHRCSQCKCLNLLKFKPSACDMLQASHSNAGSNRLSKNRKTESRDSLEMETTHHSPPSLREHLSSSSSSSVLFDRPKKRALLCGVTYNNWKHKLHGTVGDVRNMRELLIKHFGYLDVNIRILTEEATNPRRIPTKKNIQRSMKWLVEGCEAGDSLVFYFSGHGLRQPDFNMDELDGFDETICPVDFLEEGMISDNEINSTIVWPLKKDVKLHAIVDACHSGTVLDLAYVYDQKRGEWMDNRPPSGARKSTSGGLAISLSACGDDQFAADTSILTPGKTMNGAMTFILVDLINNYKRITYGSLLEYMEEAIQRANQQGCLGYRFLRRLFRHKVIQEPLLSSSEQFDVHKKIFIL